MPKDPNRPTVLLRRVSRHTWGPDPDRVVVVALTQAGGTSHARVFGAEGGRAVELESIAGSSIARQRGPVTIVHPDGSSWPLVGVGCACNVPGPLKGLNPLGVPAG